jgi:rubrerythrin
MMYEIYAEKVEDPRSKKLFKELAQEELGHKYALEKINPDHPGAFKCPTVSSAEFSDFSNRPEISKESTMQEVLQYAIAEEQDAFNYYTSLADYASDKKLHDVLCKLAAEEKAHKQKLERMYDDMFQPEN